VIESQLCTAAVQNYASVRAHVCISAERYQLDTNVEILQRMPRKIGKIINLRVSQSTHLFSPCAYRTEILWQQTFVIEPKS